jgi:hypothetical protein
MQNERPRKDDNAKLHGRTRHFLLAIALVGSTGYTGKECNRLLSLVVAAFSGGTFRRPNGKDTQIELLITCKYRGLQIVDSSVQRKGGGFVGVD